MYELLNGDALRPRAEIGIIEVQKYLTEVAAEERRRSLRTFCQRAWSQLVPQRVIWGWALDCICEHLAYLSLGEIRFLMINVPPRTGKPVYSEETVVEKTRGSIPLRDIKVGDQVLTHKGRFRRVAEVHDQGVIPTVTINTRCGRALKAAPDHPILTTNGWRAAGDLVAGDLLAVVRPQDKSGSAFDRREARLLGYLIGDGSLGHTPLFTNSDAQTLDDFDRCAEASGFKTRRFKSRNTYQVRLIADRDGVRWKCGEVGAVRKWLRKYGLDRTTSYTKRVPQAILGATEEVIVQFLGAYWACDGYIAARGADRADNVIGCDSVSKGLLADIQRLLSRLGINSTLRRKTAKLVSKKQPGGVYVSWSLTISTADGCARFSKLVPITHAKANRLTFKRTEFDRLHDTDRVESVETGVALPCRCLTVEGDKSFTAQDIAVHNTMIVSVLWPAWHWLHNAGEQFLCASVDDGLSRDSAILSRRLIESPWYQDQWPGEIQLFDDENTVGMYRNKKGGYRMQASLQGRITGVGGTINCFPGDELVWTEHGPMAIGDIVAQRLAIRVWSQDLDVGKTELRQVTGWHTNPGRQIVEVGLSDGVSLRCTADHRLWTLNRGWVEAGHLTAVDMLPSVTIPDVVDGGATHPVLSSQTFDRIGRFKDRYNVRRHQFITRQSLGNHAADVSPQFSSPNHTNRPARDPVSIRQEYGAHIGGSDIKYVGLREYLRRRRLSGIVRQAQAASHRTPRFTCSDGRNHPNGDCVFLGQYLRKFGAGNNVDCHGLGNSRVRMNLPFGKGAVEFRVFDVLRAGAVLQVGQTGISPISIAVSHFLSNGTRSHESLHNLLVHPELTLLCQAQHIESRIPLVQRGFQDALSNEYLGTSLLAGRDPSRLAADSAKVRDAVKPLIPHYRSPLFVRHVGHADLTYCLTVEGNHNFYAGNDKRAFLVSNCLDDPHDAKKVESDAVRHSALAWHDGAWRSRVNDWNTIRKVYVGQRTHDMDIFGHVQQQEGKRWCVVTLPMEYNPTKKCITYRNEGTAPKTDTPPIFADPRTEEREVLDPKRMSADIIDAEKAAVPESSWEAQYNQNPAGSGGFILKRQWWRPWVEPEWRAKGGKERPMPRFDEIIQVWDTAFEEDEVEDNDFSARTTWGLFKYTEQYLDPNLGRPVNGATRTCAMLLDAFQERMEYPKLRDEAIRAYNDFQPDRVLIEKKASGHSLIQELKKKRLPVKAVMLDGSAGRGGKSGDLVARANSASLMLEKQCVWYPPRAFAYEVIDNCAKFPNADHDDYVSTVVIALMYMRRYSDLEIPDDEKDEISPWSWKQRPRRRYA